MKNVFHFPDNPISAHRMLNDELWPRIKADAIQGKALTIRVADKSKSRIIEKRYHAMIADIADHIKGDLENREDAKRILISAFQIDTQKEFADEWAKFGDVRMCRGLRKEIVVLGVQSRHFTSKLASAFVEWLYAFGIEQGVKFKEKFVDPETGEIIYLRPQ